MVGMDSHFYEQTSPLSTFDSSKATSGRHGKCASPAGSLQQQQTHQQQQQHPNQQHGTGLEGSLATDLNSPELTFDHMSIQQFIRGNDLSAPTNGSNSATAVLADTVSIFPSLLRPGDGKSSSQNALNGRLQSLASVAGQHHQVLQQHSQQQQQQVSAASSVNGLNGSGQQQQQHYSHAPAAYQQQQQQHSQMPQQPSLGTDRYGLEASSSVKQEPQEAEAGDFSTSCSQNSLYSSPFGNSFASAGNDARLPGRDAEGNLLRQMHFGLGTGGGSSHSSSRHSGRGKHSSKKNVDKASDEYKKRRERNNVAVRKSREKAKVRSRETEKKVSELARENDSLRKKVDGLCKELNVLKSLLTTVGVPPDSVDAEIAKGLEMERHAFGM